MTDLFERQDQTVPQTQRTQSKLPSFKQPTVHRQDSGPADTVSRENDNHNTENPSCVDYVQDNGSPSEESEQLPQQTPNLIGEFAGRDAQPRVPAKDAAVTHDSTFSNGKQKLVRKLENSSYIHSEDQNSEVSSPEPHFVEEGLGTPPNSVNDFNKRIAEQQAHDQDRDASCAEASNQERAMNGENDVPRLEDTPIKRALGVVQNAFDRMRPRRQSPQVATITIGDRTTTAVLGSTPFRQEFRSPTPPRESTTNTSDEQPGQGGFSSTMQAFRAPGTIPSSQTEAHRTVATASQKAHEAASSSDRSSPGVQSPSQDGVDSDISPGKVAVSMGQTPADADSGDESSSTDGSGDEYLGEEGRKAKQDAKVADLIKQAEEKAAVPSQDSIRRGGKMLQGKGLRDSTTQLLQTLPTSVINIENQLRNFERNSPKFLGQSMKAQQPRHLEDIDQEEKLSLTVSREDFSHMKIVGQFNLGFILSVRPSTSPSTDDELFIIDQHASDEKFNFERLQASTTVQNQRLVRPKVLDLTAIEEEIIIENYAALIENGFVVEVDQSGNSPVGQRCKLISLPMSKEVTFDLSDLEELVALLGESPSTKTPSSTDSTQKSSYVPRPSKVRKLFAMRACRSSVMIGKTLQRRQMEKLVRHMGEIDKPWNCPHGRPTMRHVIALGDWEGWREGDGLAGMGEEGEEVDWRGWLEGRRHEREESANASEIVGEGELEGVDDSTIKVSENDLPNVDDGDEAGQIERCGGESEGSEDDEGRERRARQSISQRFLYF